MAIKDWIEKAKTEVKALKGEGVKDKLYSSQKDFPTAEAASKEFEKASEKLFLVNEWSRLPGVTSKFALYNSMGEKKSGKVQLNDYIQILLPGPSPENWVIVTKINEEELMKEFVVSPSKDPTKHDMNQEKVEHFFVDEATSTFRIELDGNRLYAAEIGKNEGVNNKGMEAGKRKLINTLIAEGGWAGVQEMQWKKLTDYLVGEIELDYEK